MWTKREIILNILVIAVSGKLKLGIKGILLIMSMKGKLKQFRSLIDAAKKLKR
ncbi:hypothetical protein [uncultured Methanomethylovorans sp.]|uniref:hypothetical protein n=1 Tax=uncultured Methanomethylovorans sp. TaxID=183759 RepID=UPI00260DE404|nr:hypothetical protein [uncultured Methanomethylovorans sp.]